MAFSLNIPQLGQVPNKSILEPGGQLDRQWNNYFTSLGPAVAAIQSALTNSAAVQAAQAVFPVTQYGALGDGVADDGPAFRAAYSAAVANGGGTVYIPPTTAFYRIATSVNNMISAVPVTWQGAGRSSLVKRGANMPGGIGVFDVGANAQNVAFDNFMMDGAVLVPTPLTFAAFGGDPLSPLLATNSSFWIHDGAQQIKFTNMVIAHTGGYAILANANLNDITDLSFFQLQLENCRPNLFGLVQSDINYGSWTGGVLFHGNGVSTTAMIRRANFLSCSARCCTGNAFWQHLYGFSSLHEEINFTDMHGMDIGRDFVNFGGVMGYTLIGGTARRVGYISLADNAVGTPRWLNGQWGVAVDHSGLALGGVMAGFVVTSSNGAGFDCDGMAKSSVVACSVRVPSSTDPEYVTDQIANGFNFAAAYGIQTSNTNNLEQAGFGNTVVGCSFENLSAGAVRLYASRDGHVSACRINHPSNAGMVPVLIGNIGPGTFQKSTANTVMSNHIAYDPAAAVPCVAEDGSISPFTADQINYCLGNVVIDPINKLAFEFEPAAGSSSIGTKSGTFTPTKFLSGMCIG